MHEFIYAGISLIQLSILRLLPELSFYKKLHNLYYVKYKFSESPLSGSLYKKKLPIGQMSSLVLRG